jgi:hypothetical protein
VIGGVVLVGLTYWFIYLRPQLALAPVSPQTTLVPHAPAHAEAKADGQQGRANALKLLSQQHLEQVVGVKRTGEALAGHALRAGLLA